MQKPNSWSDKNIIAAFLNGGNLKEEAVNYIMNEFIHYLPSVAKKTGLTREEALDSFTDAIMDLIEQVAKGRFEGKSKLSSYFYKIFYFKSVDLFRKKTTNKIDYRDRLPDSTDPTPLATNKMETDEEISQLYKYLDQLGNPCKQILLDWGFWGYSMNEIANRVGLESSIQAKDRKYKCLKQIRKLIS